MASPSDSISMALFCDFENVALGVRDAQYEKFDIKPILERLLLKGSIVVKKAYCDWERYKGFKATMHEANFELIEIPHVRQSGKNSADIRLVVDALDLCYTKSHVNTFVIISGDSDFSPLVSKLRENNKQVIGVGVKQSTSDLLIANCDEFIFYDDLVRENQRAQARRQNPGTSNPPAPRRSPEEERSRKETQEARRTQGVELAAETFEALLSERGDTGKIWASVLKEAIKRRKPDFSEGRYGFRTFGNLLEEAQGRGLLEFGRDEKSGAYVFRSHGASASGAEPAVRVDPPAERQNGGGYFRHDFHAVASMPDASATSGDSGVRGARSRGRRADAPAPSVEMPPEVHHETPAENRAGLPTSGVRDEALPERPARSYFRQQVPASAEAEANGDRVTAAGDTPQNEETVPPLQVSAAPLAGAESDETDAPTPAPRSRRAASTPRKSSGRKADEAGGSAQADSDTDASAGAGKSAKASIAASAPAKEKPARARSKPRGAGKPPQTGE